MGAVRLAALAAVAWLLAAAPAAAAAPQVLYVGDSLGVGTTSGVARELGSSAAVHGDSRIGRPSGEGLRVLQQSISAADDIVVFDLGTNDDPARPAALAADLAAARRATGRRCMVVATLNRPPLNGVSVDGLNQAVLAFASAARNVQLVDWNAIAQSDPGLLGPDRVHPTPQGYALRAQLFAEAIGACAAPAPADADSLATPTPRPKARARKRRPPRIRVPGIESSGISFTEPVRVRGRNAQLLLPNTKPPYPAVVMLGGRAKAAEFLAAHGVAALTGSRSDPAAVQAAVTLLRRRRDIRSEAVGLWAFDPPPTVAAARGVAALVLVSPAALPELAERDWRARRIADSPAVTTWLRVHDRDPDPAPGWDAVTEPVLAIWGTRDEQQPVRSEAAALDRALAAGANRDRTFRWFAASHDGTVAGRYPPGLLEETARWLGLHLGAGRAAPVVHAQLPPGGRGPDIAATRDASLAEWPPVQLLWLIAPALALAVRRAWLPIAAGFVCAAGIAIGVALALTADDPLGRIAGLAWPFAIAWVGAAALALATAILARRRASLPAVACAAWLALALFWLM